MDDRGVSRRGLLLGVSALGVTGAALGAYRWRNPGQGPGVTELKAASAPIQVPPQPELVPGEAPFLTPAADFFRIDNAPLAPRINAGSYRLAIQGRVARELNLSYADLMGYELTESLTTLACVSNEVGGGLIGNGIWRGIPLKRLLADAGATIEGSDLVATGDDGFTAVFSAATAVDGRDALLALGLNGAPLSYDHGFPARLVVAGLYGYVSATKWIRSLKVVPAGSVEGFWTPRGWSALGPVKLSSRFDTPSADTSVPAGPLVLAGKAWGSHPIAAVSLRLGEGPWQPATLESTGRAGSWVSWRYTWDATPGEHRLAVRATDSTGAEQETEVVPTVPDGATGLHTVTVRVGS